MVDALSFMEFKKYHFGFSRFDAFQKWAKERLYVQRASNYGKLRGLGDDSSSHIFAFREFVLCQVSSDGGYQVLSFLYTNHGTFFGLLPSGGPLHERQ